MQRAHTVKILNCHHLICEQRKVRQYSPRQKIWHAYEHIRCLAKLFGWYFTVNEAINS